MSAKSIGAVNGFEITCCSRCRTVYTAELPSSQEDAEDYSVYYHEGNLAVPAFVEQRLEDLVKDFEAFRVGNRWLDVGCGAGTLLRAAVRRGWDVIGTEVSERAVDAGRSQGLDVRAGELERLDLEPASFDVVSAIEVLEHVPSPDGLVAAAARLIRPGGALYVTTPHADGLSARLLRKRWSVISPPEHLQLLSIRGLKTLLQGSGLEILRIRTETINPRELIDTLRHRPGIGGGERVASGYRLNEALTARVSGRILKVAVNAALNTLRLGDTLKVTAGTPG
jgi:2-polyprenyl-3-methyl-5-hydroxy-6-metoxy-1,4-benzoquinol methylase